MGLNEDEIVNLGRVIAAILLGLYLFWVFAVPPIISWLSANAFTLMLIGGVCLLGVAGFFTYTYIEGDRAAQQAAEYADLQRRRGLEEYETTDGKVVWVPREQLEAVAKKDCEMAEARKLVNQLVIHIEQFTPSREYKNEWGYHIELQGYIKGKFPDAQIEVQTGSSRPDIVVQNIAIEVKGPTFSKDLQTIADKLVRYSQHYDTVIVVLFNLQVKKRRYSEWECGIMDTFENVKIFCI